jgi:carbohydrate kinase (thermoresistant glucokinase family)
MILVIMGVSGSGKTSVGRRLGEELGWRFIEGDDFHPPENVAKMGAGTPLDDSDRWPWLERLADEIAAIAARGENAVLACSALKQAYRDRLVSKAPPETVHFVHLTGTYEEIAERLAKRKHRYMPASLLASQFAALEPPKDAIVVGMKEDVRDRVSSIRDAVADLKSRGS